MDAVFCSCSSTVALYLETFDLIDFYCSASISVNNFDKDVVYCKTTAQATTVAIMVQAYDKSAARRMLVFMPNTELSTYPLM